MVEKLVRKTDMNIELNFDSVYIIFCTVNKLWVS